MKKIVGDLLKNRNVDNSLKEYYGRFMEINNKYAGVRLAMNYYTFYVMVSEEGMLPQTYKAISDKINTIIEKYVDSVVEISDINVLESLRNEIIEKVKSITCIVDKHNIYEHALNRVEYRFRDDDYPIGYSDEGYTRKIMQYILEDEDSTAVNTRIKEVISQLPIRFTKKKFYEMISNGLSIYEGTEVDSLDDFIYMIRTCSMLYKVSDMEENYPHICEAFEKLKNVKFRDITKAEYDDIKNILSDITAFIDDEMNYLMIIQEIINDLLVFLYTSDKRNEDKVTKSGEEIIKDTNLLFLNKLSPKSIQEIENMFVMLEGEQEKLYPLLSTYDITDKIRTSYQKNLHELGLIDIYNIVFKLPKLNSDSIFADIDRIPNNQIVDNEYLEKEKKKLIDEFSQIFAENDKLIRRAVMSAAISELPIFFNNISELQDFIYNCLFVCTDKAEKLACIELINAIIEE